MSEIICEYRKLRGAQVIPERKRLGTLPRVFGGAVNGLVFEQAAFSIASSLMPNYRGGMWDFVQLPGNGFYMSLPLDERFRLSCEGNGWTGELSGDAAGIVVCMYAYSNLSFDATGPFQERLAELYHSLRDYISAEQPHPELRGILGATD